MTYPILALMICTILPIVWSWVSGYQRHAQFGVVDNKHPREQNAKLQGVGARAVAAQLNAWEGLAVYIAALLAVTLAAVPVEKYATLALVYATLRILHGIFYVINQDILRSFAFLGAYGIAIYMFIMAL